MKKYDLSIPLPDALKAVKMVKPCWRCKGSGIVHQAQLERSFWAPEGQMAYKRVLCPDCDGEGTVAYHEKA